MGWWRYYNDYCYSHGAAATDSGAGSVTATARFRSFSFRSNARCVGEANSRDPTNCAVCSHAATDAPALAQLFTSRRGSRAACN
jgi:hypothetical protein